MTEDDTDALVSIQTIRPMTMMTKQKPSGWMKLNQITDGFSMSRLELEEVQRCHDPSDFYRLFFSSDLLEEVAIQTNIYGRQKNRTWNDTDAEKLERFSASVYRCRVGHWTTRGTTGH
ncbi:hypothetical protein GCK32_004170 [Trichostrongylus colubriformis]|uniref:PiggyBac transposable element-derived protein domain-containing protein n=1 Tax=Trichostrongylus colubriformis TaxID=6319 RepID=A0AAN8FNW9_TRICO